MADFYERMAGVASRLLTRFAQGRVQFLREAPGTPDPDEPWTPGEPIRELLTLNATVRRVEQRYVDGTLIVGTEDQVTFAVPPVMPRLTDTIVIDGAVRSLIDMRPIPAAGTPVAYIAFVAGGGQGASAFVLPELDFTFPANSQFVVLF